MGVKKILAFFILISAMFTSACLAEEIAVNEGASPALVKGANDIKAISPFKITSAVFDTSNSIIVLTAQDSPQQEAKKSAFTPLGAIMDDYKLVVLENPKRAYFDIDSAVLTFPKQDWTFESGPIKQVKISQFSLIPNVVRVVMYIDDSFNLNDMKFLRVKNNIILKFKNDFCKNDYFQNTYRDEHESSSDFYEYMTVKIPDGESSVKKELKLNTQYYMQDIIPKTNAVLINGFGALTIEKPMILTNPSRIVYDLSNTLVAPNLRNKEFRINEKDTVKIGQFSVNKARIVITTENVNGYIPIYSADNQSLLIADSAKVSNANLLNNPSDIMAYKKDKSGQTSTMSVSFSEPVVHGIDRLRNQLTVYLYNVCNYNEEAYRSAFAGTLFAKAVITPLPHMGVKLTVPLEPDTLASTYLGADSKVLTVKIQEPKRESSLFNKPKDGAGKTIVIDPGHGGSDYGAIRDNLNEKDVALNVSKRLRDILAKQGYLVHMTRDKDEYVTLEDRVNFAQKLEPDIFISVHLNSSVKPEINGIETHYWRQESISLAQTLHSGLVSVIPTTNRGLFKSKFYVINHTTMPAVLIEIGFISNDAERAQLGGKNRQEATAKAIAGGIEDYFKGGK